MSYQFTSQNIARAAARRHRHIAIALAAVERILRARVAAIKPTKPLPTAWDAIGAVCVLALPLVLLFIGSGPF